MAGQTTVTVELPAALHERFAATAARAGTDVKTRLVELARAEVEMAASTATYVDGTPDRAPVADADGPPSLADLPPPIGLLLGFDLGKTGDGRAEVRLAAGPEHANPMGTLHGGVLCDLGDAAMGIAFANTLEPDESFTTLQLDVTFHKPVWDAELTATGEVVTRGRRTGRVESTITDEGGSLVAKLSSLCLVLRGDAAEGR